MSSVYLPAPLLTDLRAGVDVAVRFAREFAKECWGTDQVKIPVSQWLTKILTTMASRAAKLLIPIVLRRLQRAVPAALDNPCAWHLRAQLGNPYPNHRPSAVPVAFARYPLPRHSFAPIDPGGAPSLKNPDLPALSTSVTFFELHYQGNLDMNSIGAETAQGFTA